MVEIVECPRDAWQGRTDLIPSDQKARHLRGLVNSGFRHIDAVSFVSPKAVPQMADSEEVLRLLGPVPGIDIIGIVMNEKGAERAVAACRYPPAGIRSNGPTRAPFYAGSDYQKHANDEIICMVMIANLQYGWTFFVPDIQKTFGWDRASIQIAFTLFVQIGRAHV